MFEPAIPVAAFNDIRAVFRADEEAVVEEDPEEVEDVDRITPIRLPHRVHDTSPPMFSKLALFKFHGESSVLIDLELLESLNQVQIYLKSI